MRPLLTVLLAGCARIDDDAYDVPITSATLEDLDSNSFLLVVGPVVGDALLVYESAYGDAGALPVSVSGGGVGLAFDLSVDLQPGSDVPLDLSEADAGLTLRDLLGTYSGTAGGGGAIIGGAGQHMRNKAGVQIDDSYLTFGVGLQGSIRWVRIREGGGEGVEVDTGPFVLPPVETADTGDSADTGPARPPADTDAPPADDGGGGGGCGDGDGCGGGGGGGGCGCGEACDSCSAGAAFLPFGVLFGTYLRRRRRPASQDPRSP